MGVAEVRRLKQLDDKSAKLKRMVAGLSVDRSSLRDVLRKKPDAQRAPRTGLIRARCLAGEGAPQLGFAADLRTAPTRWLPGQQMRTERLDHTGRYESQSNSATPPEFVGTRGPTLV
jgi:hypothetical protein